MFDLLKIKKIAANRQTFTVILVLVNFRTMKEKCSIFMLHPLAHEINIDIFAFCPRKKQLYYLNSLILDLRIQRWFLTSVIPNLELRKGIDNGYL